MSHHESGRRDPVEVLRAELSALPGGISGQAKRIGRSPGVLHNKFSEAMPHYEVTVRESLALADGVPNTQFPDAVAEHFGGVFFRLPGNVQGDDDVMDSYLQIIQQMGDLSREFTEARADGVIEPDEFNAIELRARRTVAAILRNVEDIRATVRELPPDGVVQMLGRGRG